MSHSNHLAAQVLTQQAANWVARLGGEPGEADWLAFEAWLNGDGERRAAYDAALALSLTVDREAVALTDRLASRRLDGPTVRRSPIYWGAGLMAAAAVAVTFAALNPQPEPKAT